MSIVFDGKKFAADKEKVLKKEIASLKNKPKLVSILVGNDKASLLYTKLKQKAAIRVGAKFIIKKFPDKVTHTEIIKEIGKLNKDKKINGIMVQLPLPGKLKVKTRTIVNSIDKNKDVDGLRNKSQYKQATVKGIESILDFATKDLAYFGKRATVVGAKGIVGKGVVTMLEERNYKVCICDKDTRDLYAKLTNADLVVSATGVPELIKGEMIKEGSIAIDVGSPKGDFDGKVTERASFVTPVPGGVGPVTIVSLLENLVEAVK
ncbi:MAG TPA: bifunctional 5,10-methylenetetrahydrofolate dehydrogenase/5,10-methenyltetrahydrofolate cyclohydrolase [Patescibacteria group bacterium]|nr:bifunctional 5,10-methylenetetrahydrofolate dehydrogenase/5,10-methenyltetrahydrofolate cyclohydrolase [Patescibacteria group bacterium]